MSQNVSLFGVGVKFITKLLEAEAASLAGSAEAAGSSDRRKRFASHPAP